MTESAGIRFLVVDDEETIRRLCVTIAEGLGFTCMEADTGEAALALLEEQPAHIILTDLVMPQMSGLEFLERAKKMLPLAEVAVMTGHSSVETAVQAMKLGAYDYISKPFSPLEELRLFLPPRGACGRTGHIDPATPWRQTVFPKRSCYSIPIGFAISFVLRRRSPAPLTPSAP